GACSVILDDKVTRSCMKKIGKIEEYSKVTTIEGIGAVNYPHPLQELWVAFGAVQCGFCVPGFIVSAYQLLKENVEMTETYFKDIEEMFGEKAKDILWELFIQDRSQTDVGEDYEMSRRQVQYAMDKWLQKLFEKELQKTEQSDRQ
ncbi:MAG: hypothetical protein J6D38_02480, partial [Solobacterium sp.]|nr:hypothetical protein [Solobacterium sp.]